MAFLELKNINHYFGGLQAVSNFNLNVEEGVLSGLIGPNGAGKTTIFNLVSGFYKPTEGEIRFCGESIRGLKPHEVTGLGISRTFQNIRLWNSMTVLENLCISQHYRLGYGFIDSILYTGKYIEREKKVIKSAREFLEILEMKEYENEYPKNLSYGLQRRLEIGRALTVRPKILLLDEPAAGMASGDIEQLIQLIKWIREKFRLTIWLIEHQMKVVMALCDKIDVLDFGEIIAEGTPSEIRKNPRVIKAYLGEEVTVNA